MSVVSEHTRALTAILPDCRQIVLWETTPPEGVEPVGVVVIASGFGRRMHHQSYLAHHLATNGFVILRYDAADHVGLSDGDILDYSMSSGFASLSTAIATAAERRPGLSIGLVASSISGRLAIAAAGRCSTVDYCILISGVVHLQRTLAIVHGVDYAACEFSVLPPTAVFEGHHVSLASFYADGHAANWFGLNGTMADLRNAAIPMVFCYGEQDEWVQRSDVVAVTTGNQQHRLVELAGVGHDITRNPGVGRIFLSKLVAWCRELAGASAEEMVEPEFSQLLRVALNEKRGQRRAEASAKCV